MIDLVFRGRTLVFESALSREEVTERLRREVAPATWQRRETRSHLFEGTFADDRFHLIRTVRGRNSFRPIIEGQLVPQPNGVRIDVRLRLHPAILIVCGILFTTGAAVAAIAVSEFLSTRQRSPQLFVTVLMTLVFSIFLIAPGVEARKSTQLLSDLFESKPRRP